MNPVVSDGEDAGGSDGDYDPRTTSPTPATPTSPRPSMNEVAAGSLGSGETGRFCIASFDYEGEQDDELSFQTGDSIAILRNIDAEWLEGKLGEKTGIFPITFVSFPGGDGDAGAAAAGFELVASFDYEGEQDDELSFSKGDVIVAAQTVDSDWFQGSFDGKQGIFPSAYVAWASALYDYEGAESDELSFVQGDRVNLNERIDDEWLRGTTSDGRSGMFPCNFVQIEASLPGEEPVETPAENVADESKAREEDSGGDTGVYDNVLDLDGGSGGGGGGGRAAEDDGAPPLAPLPAHVALKINEGDGGGGGGGGAKVTFVVSEDEDDGSDTGDYDASTLPETKVDADGTGDAGGSAAAGGKGGDGVDGEGGGAAVGGAGAGAGAGEGGKSGGGNTDNRKSMAPTLVIPASGIIKEGLLKKKATNTRAKQMNHRHNWKDRLLKLTATSLSYYDPAKPDTPKGSFACRSISAVNLSSIGGFNGGRFEVVGLRVDKGLVSLECDAGEAGLRDEWVAAIEQTVASVDKSTKEQQQLLFETEWAADADHDDCMRCQSKFNFRKRRHHCRVCGFVVCGDCSPTRIYPKHSATEKIRVCSVCLPE